MIREPIYVMTGPTAVGKTALAIEWAEEHDAEIVSCDSLLFYRGMDIGTAKPSAEERARVPHHLIDCVSADKQLNINDYCRIARDAVEEIQARGKKVLVVGGSGFYLKSFFAPVVDDCEVPVAVRSQVAGWWREGGLTKLQEELRALNPNGSGNLDIDNPRRVIRALERCLTTGKTVQELEQAFASRPGYFDEWPKQTTLLMRSKEALEERIRKRTALMLKSGLLEEVKMLIDAGFRQNPSASGAIGYREVLVWLKEGGKLADLEEAIVVSTRQLVAKQVKWFRRQLKPDAVLNLLD